MAITSTKCAVTAFEGDYMNTSYHIRTSRNAPVFSFDSLDRAKAEMARAQKRLSAKLHIVKVTKIEEIIEE